MKKLSFEEKVEEVLNDHVNPALELHGGFVDLVEVRDKQVLVRLGGGCQGCAASQQTLKMGIENMLKEEVDEEIEIVDVTNHASGENPYIDFDFEKDMEDVF